jgi:hypothetical protein
VRELLAVGAAACALVGGAALMGAFGQRETSRAGAEVPRAVVAVPAEASPTELALPASRAGIRARLGAPTDVTRTDEGECWTYRQRRDDLEICFRPSGPVWSSRDTKGTSKEYVQLRIGSTVP